MTQRLRAMPTLLFTLLAALFMTAMPIQLEAQDENRGRETMPEAPEIEDGELRTFARVYLDVAQVRTGLQRDMEQAEGEAEAQELRQAAQMEMRAILDESPLTIERYTRIGQVLNTDPEQRAEFQAVVREIQEERGGGLA